MFGDQPAGPPNNLAVDLRLDIDFSAALRHNLVWI